MAAAEVAGQKVYPITLPTYCTHCRTVLRHPVAALHGCPRGLIANAINPKVALFSLSFLPQFVNEAQGDVEWQLGLLGTLFALQAATLFGLLGYFSGTVGRELKRRPANGALAGSGIWGPFHGAGPAHGLQPLSYGLNLQLVLAAGLTGANGSSQQCLAPYGTLRPDGRLPGRPQTRRVWGCCGC